MTAAHPREPADLPSPLPARQPRRVPAVRPHGAQAHRNRRPADRRGDRV